VPCAPYYHESTHPKGRCETLDSDGTGKEILCYFSGTIHIPSAHTYADEYSKGVRQYLFKIRSKFKNIIINEGIDPNYRANVRKSRYFLCPEGWAPSSHRFREAQAALCIPVLISDAKKPFWKYIDYESNIIRISTDDTESLDRLEEILENDLATDYDRKVDFWRKHRKFLLMDPTKGLEQPCGTLILKELEDYLN
jgi:hypothetical protein